MVVLNISSQKLTKLEIKGNYLITYSGGVEQRRFHFSGVTSLDCSNNQLVSLPNSLPEGLKILHCSHNQLTSLPILPESLEKLICHHNQLIRLPDYLPTGLKGIYCVSNRLTNLPLLPEGLEDLLCHGNQLTSLPDPLPKRLEMLFCYDNPLNYVPFFKTRPRHLSVPRPLTCRHTRENYQEGYRTQEVTRYLFLTFYFELDLQVDFIET